MTGRAQVPALPPAELRRTRREVTARHGTVLVWVPVLLLAAALDLPEGVTAVVVDLLLVATATAATVVAVLTSWPRPTALSATAVGALAAAVLAGSWTWPSWSSAWLLVSMAAGVGLPGAWAWVGVPLAAGAAAWAQAHHGAAADEVTAQAFVVALAGVAAAAFARLVATTAELRRTRADLAAAAVARERERVSRDLHDILGHSLSVIVVKAQAARRLAPTDPKAAAAHAADVEQVGRTALAQVRRTIDATVAPTLEDELAGARDVLAAAGITLRVSTDGDVPTLAGSPLAWALREGVTNVLRHSGALECRIDVARTGGGYRLTVHDDGHGATATAPDGAPDGDRRRGGLDGLAARLDAVGGRLRVVSAADGFTLSAWVPGQADNGTGAVR